MNVLTSIFLVYIIATDSMDEPELKRGRQSSIMKEAPEGMCKLILNACNNVFGDYTLILIRK